MQYKNGKLYMKSNDVLELTGLSQGQLNNLRQKNDLEAVQFVDGGDCYYRPENVLEAHRQILDEKRVGSTRLRKSPTISNPNIYKGLVGQLQRADHNVEDIQNIKTLGDGSMVVDYQPHLLPTDLPSKTHHEEVTTTSSETTEEAVADVAQTIEPPPTPDTLPFRFHMGNAKALPSHEEALEDFENVADNCFGYYDETNSECGGECKFSSSCAALRFHILVAIGEGKDNGEDPSTTQEREQHIREEAIEKIRTQL